MDSFIDIGYPILLILHVFICIFLILLVMVQSDKGGGLASAFGGMGGNAAFSGASAATILTKITQWTAIVSFAIILLLNGLSTKKSGPQAVESELRNPNALSNIIPQGAGGVGAPIQGIPQATMPAPAVEPSTPAAVPAENKTEDATVPGLPGAKSNE